MQQRTAGYSTMMVLSRFLYWMVSHYTLLACELKRICLTKNQIRRLFMKTRHFNCPTGRIVFPMMFVQEVLSISILWVYYEHKQDFLDTKYAVFDFQNQLVYEKRTQRTRPISLMLLSISYVGK